MRPPSIRQPARPHGRLRTVPWLRQTAQAVRLALNHDANPLSDCLTTGPLPQQPGRIDLGGAQRRDERRCNADSDQEHGHTAIGHGVVRSDLVQYG